MKFYSQRATTATLGLIFSQRAVAQQAEVVIADAGNICPPGYAKIMTEAGCKAAMKPVALSNFQGSESDSGWPGGCYHCDGVADCVDGVWFNKDAVGSSNGEATPICAAPSWWEVDTLFVGDSDIEYWDTEDFPDSDNVGVAGDLCKDLIKLIDAQLQRHKPKRVVIVCGENDFFDYSVDQTFATFQEVIGKIIASGARAFYLGTKPEPASRWWGVHGKYLEYDAKIRDYVTALDANDPTSSPPLVMVDVNPAFKELGNPDWLYAKDNLHLSKWGYMYWNAWTKTALADTSGCARWMNDECAGSTAPSPPTPECEDDPKTDCAWVGKNSSRKKKWCKKNWQGTAVSVLCPVTCGKCKDDDYNDNAGVLSAVDKGSVF